MMPGLFTGKGNCRYPAILIVAVQQSGAALFVEKILNTFQEPITVLRPIPSPDHWTSKEQEKAYRIRRIAMMSLCCNDPSLTRPQKRKLFNYFWEGKNEGKGLIKLLPEMPPKVVFELIRTYKASRIPNLIRLFSQAKETKDVVTKALIHWDSRKKPPKSLDHLLESEIWYLNWSKETPFDNELKRIKYIHNQLKERNKKLLLDRNLHFLCLENRFQRVFPLIRRDDDDERKDLLGIGYRDTWHQYSFDDEELYTVCRWIYEALETWNPHEPCEVLLFFCELLYGSEIIRESLQDEKMSKKKLLLEMMGIGEWANTWRNFRFFVDCLTPKEFFQILKKASPKEVKKTLKVYLKEAKKFPLLWDSLMNSLVWMADKKISSVTRLSVLSIWCSDHRVRCELLSKYPKSLGEAFYTGQRKVAPLKTEQLETLFFSLEEDPDLTLAQVRLLFRESDFSKDEERAFCQTLLEKSGHSFEVLKAAWEGSCVSQEGPGDFYVLLEKITSSLGEESLSDEDGYEESWTSQLLLLWPTMHFHHEENALRLLHLIPETILYKLFLNPKRSLSPKHLGPRFTPKFFRALVGRLDLQEAGSYELLERLFLEVKQSQIWERFLGEISQLPTRKRLLFLRILPKKEREEMIDLLFPKGISQDSFVEMMEWIFCKPVLPGYSEPMGFISGVNLMFALLEKVKESFKGKNSLPLELARKFFARKWDKTISSEDLFNFERSIASKSIERESSPQERLLALEAWSERQQKVAVGPIAQAYERSLRTSKGKLPPQLDLSFWENRWDLFLLCVPHFEKDLASLIFPLYLETIQSDILQEQIQQSRAGNKAGFLISLIPLEQRANYLVKQTIRKKGDYPGIEFYCYERLFNALSELTDQWMHWSPEKASPFQSPIRAAWDLFRYRVLETSSPSPFSLALFLSRNTTVEDLERDLALAREHGIGDELLNKALHLALIHELYSISLLEFQEAPGMKFLGAVLQSQWNRESKKEEESLLPCETLVSALKYWCREAPKEVLRWVRRDAQRTFLKETHTVAHFLVKTLPPSELLYLLDQGTYEESNLLIRELKFCSISQQEQVIRTLIIEAQSLSFPRDLFARLMVHLGKNEKLQKALKMDEWEEKGELSHLFPQELIKSGEWKLFRREISSVDRSTQISFRDKKTFANVENHFFFPSQSWKSFFMETVEQTPHRKDLVEIAHLAYKYGITYWPFLRSFFSKLLEFPSQEPQFYLQVMVGRERELNEVDLPWSNKYWFAEELGRKVLFKLLSRGIFLPEGVEESPFLQHNLPEIKKRLHEEFFQQDSREQYEVLSCWIRDQDSSKQLKFILDSLISSLDLDTCLCLLREWDKKKLRKEWKEEKVYPLIHKQIKELCASGFDSLEKFGDDEAWALRVLIFDCGLWEKMSKNLLDEEQEAIWQELNQKKEGTFYSPFVRALVESMDYIQTPEEAKNWIQLIENSKDCRSDLGNLIRRQSKSLSPIIELAGNSSLTTLPRKFISLVKEDLGGCAIVQVSQFSLLKYGEWITSGDGIKQIELLRWLWPLSASGMIPSHLFSHRSLLAQDLRSRLVWDFGGEERPSSISSSKKIYNEELENIAGDYWAHVDAQVFVGDEGRKGYAFLDRCLKSFLHSRYEPTTIAVEGEAKSLENWRDYAFLYLVCQDPQLSRKVKREIYGLCTSRWGYFKAASITCSMPSPVALVVLDALGDEYSHLIFDELNFSPEEEEIEFYSGENKILRKWKACDVVENHSDKSTSKQLALIWKKKEIEEDLEVPAFRAILRSELLRKSEEKVMKFFQSLPEIQLRQVVEEGRKKRIFFDGQPCMIEKVNVTVQIFQWFLEALKQWENPQVLPLSLRNLALVLWRDNSEESFFPWKRERGSSIEACRRALFLQVVKGQSKNWHYLKHFVLYFPKKEFLRVLLSCSYEDCSSMLKGFASWQSSHFHLNHWIADMIVLSLQHLEKTQSKKMEKLCSMIMEVWCDLDGVQEHFLYKASRSHRELILKYSRGELQEKEAADQKQAKALVEKCIDFSLKPEDLNNQEKALVKVLFCEVNGVSQEELKKAQFFLLTRPNIFPLLWKEVEIVPREEFENLFFDAAEAFFKENEELLNVPDKSRAAAKARVKFLTALFGVWEDVEDFCKERSKRFLEGMGDDAIYDYVSDVYDRRELIQRPFVSSRTAKKSLDTGFFVLKDRIKPKMFLPSRLEECMDERPFKLLSTVIESMEKLRRIPQFFKETQNWLSKDVALLLRMTPFYRHQDILACLVQGMGREQKLGVVMTLLETLLKKSPLPGETTVETLPLINSVIQYFRRFESVFFQNDLEPAIKKIDLTY